MNHTLPRHDFLKHSTALRAIHYGGWIVPGATHPPKNPVVDTRRHADFIRNLYRS